MVSGQSLDVAVYAIEELEEAAKLYLLTRKYGARQLTRDRVEFLK